MKELKYPKQVWEVLPLTVNFRFNMNDTESIDASKSSIIVIDTQTKEDVSASLLVSNSLSTPTSTKLTGSIQGGVHNRKYCACFRAYISDTKRLEEDVHFLVDGSYTDENN